MARTKQSEADADEAAAEVTTLEGGNVPATIDAETGEMMSVTPEALQYKYGLSRAKAIAAHNAIAVAGLYHGPDEYGGVFYPLQLAGLKGTQKERVEKVLAGLEGAK